MSDALSSNHVTAVPFNKALCNAHGRRGFAELADFHPDEVLFALETYESVWKNDTHCTNQGYGSEERRDYHKQHSWVHMETLKHWCEEQTAEDGAVEPNSNLGKAMQYIIRHYDGLTAFCHYPEAPVGRVGMWRGVPRGPVSTLRSSNRTCAINASGFRRWSIYLRAQHLGFRAWQTV